jgi:hypothetical protein
MQQLTLWKIVYPRPLPTVRKLCVFRDRPETRRASTEAHRGELWKAVEIT